MRDDNKQPNLFDLIEFDRCHPISTAACCRLPVFSGNGRIATQKQKKEHEPPDIKIINLWGTLTYRKCRLNQHHRDLLDWIMARHIEMDANELIYYFNPYDFFRDMGKEHNIEIMRQWLDDLTTALVNVKTDKFNVTTSPLVAHGYDYSQATDTTKYGEGCPYFIRLSPNFIDFFKFDIRVYYHRLLDDLLAVKDARLRCIIRFCFSHRTPLNMLLKDILTYVDILRDDQTKQYRSKTIKEIKAQLEILGKFGISINSRGMVHYTKHADVWFRYPTEEQTVNQKSPVGQPKIAGSQPKLAGLIELYRTGYSSI